MPESENEVVSETRARYMRWDYMVTHLHARHNDMLETYLKEQGQMGWELIELHIPVQNDYQCIFKRPIL